MIPLARFERLDIVRIGKLVASGLHLKLLARETRVAEAQQQVLLDTHHRGDRSRLVERADPHDHFIGDGLQPVEKVALRTRLVERREGNPVVGEAGRGGHGAGLLDEVPHRGGAAQQRYVAARDGNRKQVGNIQRQFGQPLEIDVGFGRGDIPGGNRKRCNRKVVVRGVEQFVVGAVAGVVEVYFRSVDGEGRRNVVTHGTAQDGGEFPPLGLDRALEEDIDIGTLGSGVEVERRIVGRLFLVFVAVAGRQKRCETRGK